MRKRRFARSVVLAVSVASLGFAQAGKSSAAPQLRLMCSPDHVRNHAMLHISKLNVGPVELGVRTPSGEFFFIYSCEERLRVEPLRQLSCEAFAAAKTLRLEPSTLVALSSSSGYKQELPVFAQPGAYELMLAKNLETENTQATVARCKVHFTPAAK
jgi:hypothetical protein